MQNPWIFIPLKDYEDHMQRKNVFQAQTLSERMRLRFADTQISSIIILGIAGGNGLEHASPHVKSIVGVDINADYLADCKTRFASLDKRLQLICADLSDPHLQLPPCDLMTADLLIEYIGLSSFASLIARSRPMRISCTIQSDGKTDGFISESPYRDRLDALRTIHSLIGSNELCETMARLDYILKKKTSVDLPNGKSFLCLDFSADI